MLGNSRARLGFGMQVGCRHTHEPAYSGIAMSANEPIPSLVFCKSGAGISHTGSLLLAVPLLAEGVASKAEQHDYENQSGSISPLREKICLCRTLGREEPALGFPLLPWQ